MQTSLSKKQSHQEIKTVSILGCGWFGLALAKKLVDLNYTVKGSTTTPEKLGILKENRIQPYLINFTADQVSADPAFFDTDVLFICIPPKRNSTELNAYPKKIKLILDAAKNKSKHVVLISSTSVYDDENKIVDENTEANPGTDSGKVILEAENLLKGTHRMNIKHHADIHLMSNDAKYTIIRFAGLIGPNRDPGRFFTGKKDVANGLAPVNLIQQADAVGIACKLLKKQAFGRIYNACSPEHPTKQDFYTAAAKASGLIEPEFIAEKKNWKIVESVHVPKFLQYEFEKPLSS